MRLSFYSDYSLRLLMYLGVADPNIWVRTADIARAFGISLHHLQKATSGLVRAGYVEAVLGRSGGIRLAKPPAEIQIGNLVAALEGTGCLVDCVGDQCPLAHKCLLKKALDAAERSFVAELNRYTLADVIAPPTAAPLRELLAAPA